jgi:hypothetical protein
MTVTLVCYACRATCNAPVFIDYVDSLYLFGMVMKIESRYYVWDTSCADCSA